jgi:hypothetical protein
MNNPIHEEELDTGLRELLERAYPGPDCPPPEVYLSDAALNAADRSRVEAHARTCPACAAERELARSFDATGKQSEDAEAIVQKLQTSAPWKSRKVTPMSGRPRTTERNRRRPAFMGLPLAMAAGVLIAVGAALQLLGPHAPPIGAPGTGSAMRGADIEVMTPAGDIATAPDELDWQDVPNAVSYRVRILLVDGEPLWTETVAGSPAKLPQLTASALHASVLYRWQVEALDANGTRIAWSKPTQFRIVAGESDH